MTLMCCTNCNTTWENNLIGQFCFCLGLQNRYFILFW